ncbi:ABC transporter permease [Microbacterium sp. PRC9]|uniref:ABC transporter permease n=1 Tax=Microbacterium sp. PRC9 TaxID=2962591 RepID=UPI002881655A|nr:ABC transporter permease [Microbacterium sp. PRC9]MDT0144528.1 ABC transporter permease [Microbacterium sp. PRC9]
MLRILGRWAASALPVLLLVSVLTFVLSSLIPGNVARVILGVNATQEQIDALTEELGLNQPVFVRYWNWLVDAVHGDLGTSVINGQPVSSLIADRIGLTISLIVGAVVLAAVVGVLLGVFSALRGGWAGKLVDVIALLGLAIPGFWFGLVLVALFAVTWQIFPATGYTPPTESVTEWLRSLVLPWITLGIPAAAPVAKQTRDGMLASLGKDYVRVLRARGIAESSIIFKHVLRNAASPVVTVLGIVAVVLLGGTVLVETVFVMPGLGGLSVIATSTHDIPVIQGLAVVFTIIVMIVSLIIEFVYAFINPKVRS